MLVPPNELMEMAEGKERRKRRKRKRKGEEEEEGKVSAQMAMTRE
jgi:hypothetical protein